MTNRPQSYFSQSTLTPRTGIRRMRRAFTLIEMLIVLGIIAMLAGLVVANLGGIFDGARIDTAKAFCKSGLDVPLLKYKMDLGNYPTTAEGFSSLMSAQGAKAAKWRGPYIDKVPEDPWGNIYQYRFPGVKNAGKYDLFSYGPDGVESGDDIGNWDK
ncbi:MAG: type II secretion system major pseudopilin GspG [Verrucomicrobiota bacterium]|nr:type II secretion system major pseudopilin GspG [Verrucomicrobiota bacterium]